MAGDVLAVAVQVSLMPQRVEVGLEPDLTCEPGGFVVDVEARGGGGRERGAAFKVTGGKGGLHIDMSAAVGAACVEHK